MDVVELGKLIEEIENMNLSKSSKKELRERAKKITINVISKSNRSRGRMSGYTAFVKIELEKMKERAGPYRYKKPRYSTGEDSYIKHSTGQEFDYKAYYTHELEKEDKIKKRVRSRPRFEGDEHLEMFQTVLTKRMHKKLGR